MNDVDAGQESLTDGEQTRRIKSALKKAFPRIKFAVTRGGEYIRWDGDDNGPTIDEVANALIAAKCAVETREPTTTYNGETWRRLDLTGGSSGYRNSIWFVCWSAAAEEAKKAEAARREEEEAQRLAREGAALDAAAEAKRSTMPTPPPRSAMPMKSAPEAFKVFDELSRRADTFPNDETERQRRPSWAPSLIIEGELLDACIELGRLQPENKPLVRLWAQFADPKKKGVALREQRSSIPLLGCECRGFELHAGTERGNSGEILFEAQHGERGWRFGPHLSEREYKSRHDNRWSALVRERERSESGFYSPNLDVKSANLARLNREIAELEAKDRQAATEYYRRRFLRNRIAELGRDRVLNFAGAPGLQMAMGARLSGNCFNCGRGLTDVISLERGIGPECIEGKINYIMHKQLLDDETLSWITGMPTPFVVETRREAVREIEIARSKQPPWPSPVEHVVRTLADVEPVPTPVPVFSFNDEPATKDVMQARLFADMEGRLATLVFAFGGGDPCAQLFRLESAIVEENEPEKCWRLLLSLRRKQAAVRRAPGFPTSPVILLRGAHVIDLRALNLPKVENEKGIRILCRTYAPTWEMVAAHCKSIAADDMLIDTTASAIAYQRAYIAARSER